VGSGNGIEHQTGTLSIENTVVDGWNYGLQSQSPAEALFVKGSIFRNSLNDGILINLGSTGRAVIDHSFFERNNVGIYAFGGSVRVSNSVLSGNASGAIVQGAGTEATFQRCEVSGNNYGLRTFDSGVLRASGTTVSSNTFGLHNNISGTLESFGNNVVRGNGTDTTGAITSVALQ
jgi:hypothetical protein